MREISGSALRYWFNAIFRPGRVFEEFKADPYKVFVSFLICLIFAVLYAVTAYLLYAFGHKPAFPPWIPIPDKKYYLYQVFWTVPWGLAVWILISGASHLVAIAGKKDFSKYRFEDALAVCSLGFVVPWFFFGWIPETFYIPYFGVTWPDLIELMRVMVLPNLWQISLIAIGIRKTHEVGWARGIGIGILTVAIFGAMFMAFIR